MIDPCRRTDVAAVARSLLSAPLLWCTGERTQKGSPHATGAIVFCNHRLRYAGAVVDGFFEQRGMSAVPVLLNLSLELMGLNAVRRGKGIDPPDIRRRSRIIEPAQYVCISGATALLVNRDVEAIKITDSGADGGSA